ncbi:MAG: S8 family serine peptidase [Lewinellaceae bacterium]|nr:S8 family serine peptidase [Lewinellaceae bacterium]
MANDYTFIPQAWRDSEGKNVTIALFDTGVNLDHPALAHLNQAGCKFDAAAADFNPDTCTGNDAIPDATFMGNLHGTQTCGVIAARPAGAININGIAPQARILLFKVRDNAGESYAEYFIKALKAALRLGAEIIAAPYTPTFKQPPVQAEIDALFEQMRNTKVQLFTTGPNTARLDRLNNLQFPANRSEVIVTGVLQDALLRNWKTTDRLAKGFEQVWPEAEGEFCNDPQSNPVLSSNWRNSHATTALAAIAALRISVWKATEGNNYNRRSRTQLLDALQTLALPFTPAALLNDKALKPYHLRQNV